MVIFLFVLALQLPFFLNPSLILDRGNDLQEFFWPIIEFTKSTIFTHKQIPLWYNSILSGTPLLPDPQSMIFYLPNIIFLFLPMREGFLISIFLHTLAGGLGVYLLTKKLYPSLFYVSAPALAGAIEAGHFGIITAWAWLPFALHFVLKRSYLAAAFLALIFYSHVLIFALTLAALSFMAVYKGIEFTYLVKIYLLTFGLVAVVLFPMLEWSPDTTRFLLRQNPDTFPKWRGIVEPAGALFAPWTTNAGTIRTDKFISTGMGLPLLAFLGYLTLDRKKKYLLAVFGVGAALILLNNLSPAFPLLVNFDPFKLLRVTTRVWFIVLAALILLASRASDKHKFISALVVVEFLILWFTHIQKPVDARPLAPPAVTDFIKNDPEQFRVFCLTRCISQRDAVQNNLELIDGYSTLTQTNYYRHSWQLTGGFWDYYSLSTPPIGLYKNGSLGPNLRSLGEYNTKYIISKRELPDENLSEVFKDRGWHVYENGFFVPRSNAALIGYSPNKITVDTSRLEGKSLVMAEVYSKGWRAHIGGRELPVLEAPNTQRVVEVPEGTGQTELRYSPKSFEAGKAVTGSTIIVLGISLLHTKSQYARTKLFSKSRRKALRPKSKRSYTKAKTS